MAKPGRKTLKFDLAELEKLCGLQCTQPEIAAWFNCSLSIIEKRIAQNRAFRETMERGYAKGRISVRRKQMQLLDEGSNTMAVWLGKQLLGQKDRHEITGDPSEPIGLEISARDELISRIHSLVAEDGTAGEAESGE